MSQYSIKVSWDNTSASENYRWSLDDGTAIVGDGAGTNPGRFIDPEEAFVGSLASCHMLSFLAAAAKAGFQVANYVDDAHAVLGTNENARIAVMSVLLQPTVTFTGDRKPTLDELRALHEKANRDCFIANSVKTRITVEPRIP